MSEHPNPPEEEQLRHFLRQYRPLPPAAAPDLEERILRSVAVHRPQRGLSWRWVGIPILLGALLGWGGYQRWQTQLVVQDTEALENFLVSTWGGLLQEEGLEAETWWAELGPEGS
ncbi:MAG: hypothetical protein Q6L60_01360 [Thermostichus sp. HHBFW_bins_43]